MKNETLKNNINKIIENELKSINKDYIVNEMSINGIKETIKEANIDASILKGYIDYDFFIKNNSIEDYIREQFSYMNIQIDQNNFSFYDLEIIFQYYIELYNKSIDFENVSIDTIITIILEEELQNILINIVTGIAGHIYNYIINFNNENINIIVENMMNECIEFNREEKNKYIKFFTKEKLEEF